MQATPQTTQQLQDALRRARTEPTISLRDAGVILGRSYNFMLRLVLDSENLFVEGERRHEGLEIFPGVMAYRLGKAPGSHYVIPSMPLLAALGLSQPLNHTRKLENT